MVEFTPVGNLLEGAVPFKPCAYWISKMHLVVVATKDCSYTEEWINEWSDVHWENHRPWYKPWKKCVGFSVYYPWVLSPTGFSEEMSVTEILDSVLLAKPNAFGKYKKLFYRLGKSLTVHV